MSTKTEAIAVKPSPFWINYVHDSLHEVFDMMLGMKVSHCKETAVVPEVTAIVGLAGSLCGLFSVRCSRKTGEKLAHKMLGAQGDEHEVLDALGEICNMLAGSFKSRIPEVADTCMLSIPTTIAGADYHVHAQRGGQRFEILFKCDDDLLQVILHVNC